MSYNILKSVAVISVGAIVGYSTIKYFQPQEKNRFIASYQISKMGKEQGARLLFNVKINADDLALNDSGVSTIKVTVEALKDINTNLVYKWNLPQDVDVIEGSITERLGFFTADQSQEITLKVKGFSKQLKKFISFEVNGEFEQRPIQREVLISSRIEDSFEYVIQQNEINRTKNQNFKLGDSKSKSKFSPDNIVH